MGSRPGFIVDHRVPADGGEPPNQYVAQISIQVRCHFPPRASREEVLAALDDAYRQAEQEVWRHPWGPAAQKLWLKEPG